MERDERGLRGSGREPRKGRDYGAHDRAAVLGQDVEVAVHLGAAAHRIQLLGLPALDLEDVPDRLRRGAQDHIAHVGRDDADPALDQDVIDPPGIGLDVVEPQDLFFQ